MDQELHALTLVKDHKGRSLIKESRDGDGHGSLYGPSDLWLAIKLTELSVVDTASRKKGKGIISKTIDGSGQFITTGTDRRIQISSVLSFGSDKAALQGNVSINLASSGHEYLLFFVEDPTDENSSSIGEECWSMGAFIGEEEFNNILDAMRSSRLNGVTIAFDATNSGLIFDDTHIHHLEKNCIKLLSNRHHLTHDFPIADDFIDDFYVKVYTSTTVF